MLVSILLIINGILMVIGGVLVVTLESRPIVVTGYAGPIVVLVLALWVLALGIVKLVGRRKRQR